MKLSVVPTIAQHWQHGELQAQRILIVDDVATNRLLISRCLESHGYHNLIHAADGIEALEKIASGEPELVILDIDMPRLDGLEVCRRLRSEDATRDLPVLVQTALDRPGIRRDIFQAGASDFLTKPFDGDELVARTTIQLDRRALMRGLRQHYDRTSQELALARAMQESLDPTPALQREIRLRTGLDIASHVESSSELGGDFWALNEVGDGLVAVILIDCSGHGVQAALNTFRIHALLAQLQRLTAEPVHLLTALNQRLVGLLQPGQFATVLAGVFDLREDTFRYASAGAPPPLWRPTDDSPSVLLEASGVPVGIIGSAQYDEHLVPFGRDATLLLYSDALSDTPGHDQQPLGEASVIQLLDEAVAADAQAVLELVQSGFARAISATPEDDLTLVCIRHDR